MMKGETVDIKHAEKHVDYELRKYYFMNCMSNWNSLPE
jgi:hypothetical protein